MNYEILCKSCNRKFVIESSSGETLKCLCPYCRTQIMVATPLIGHQTAVGSETEVSKKSPDKCKTQLTQELNQRYTHPTEQPIPQQMVHLKKEKRGLAMKVVIAFSIIMGMIILGSTLLYIIFSAISK